MEKKDIELIEYFRIIWKWKIFIITLVIVCVAGSIVGSIFLPKIYKASVLFMVSEPKIGEVNSLGIVMNYPQATFEKIIKNPSLEQKILKEFELAKPPYKIDLDKLDEKISVHSLKNTKLIELDVEFANAILATQIANSLADLALDLNSKLIEEEATISTNFLKLQLEEAAKKLAESEDELMAFKRKAQIETLKKELEIELTQRSRFQFLLSDAETQLASDQAKLKKIREQFKTQDKTFKLLSNLVENPSYQQSLANLSEVEIKKLLGFNMEEEEANPVYFHLEEELVDTVANIAALSAQKLKLESSLTKNATLLKQLEDELARKETRLDQLTTEFDINKENYSTLSKKYNEARIQVTSRTPELKIVSPAITPEKAIKPNILVNGLVAGMISLILAVFFVFIWDYVKGGLT